MVLGLDARFKFDEMMWAVEALDSKVSTGKVVLSESVLTSAFGDDLVCLPQDTC